MIIEFANRTNLVKRIKYTPANGSGAKLIDFLNKHSRFRPSDAGVEPNAMVYRVGPYIRIKTPLGYMQYRILTECTQFDHEV